MGFRPSLPQNIPARLASRLQETSGKAMDSCLRLQNRELGFKIPLMIDMWRMANDEVSKTTDFDPSCGNDRWQASLMLEEIQILDNMSICTVAYEVARITINDSDWNPNHKGACKA